MDPYIIPSDGIRRGCWSCRARRKRCDGAIPRCNTCERLGIPCAGFDMSRPIWMDGGVQQESYCRRLKEIVKSIRRSARRKTTSTSLKMDNSRIEADLGDYSGMSSPTTISPLPLMDEKSRSLAWPDFEAVANDLLWPNWSDGELHYNPYDMNLDVLDAHSTDLVPSREAQYPATPLNSRGSSAVHRELNATTTDCNTEWRYVMRYFDSTAKRIFPFYHNLKDDEEKGYILSLAHRSALVRHSMAGMASLDCEQEHSGRATNNWQQYYREASALTQARFKTLCHENHMPSESNRKLCIDVLVTLAHLILLDSFASDDIIISTHFEQAIITINILEKHNETLLLHTSNVESRVQGFFTSVIVRYFLVWKTAQAHKTHWPALPKLLTRLSDASSDNLCGYSWSLLVNMYQISDLIEWKMEKETAKALSTLELAKRAHVIESRLADFIESTPHLWGIDNCLGLESEVLESTSCMNQDTKLRQSRRNLDDNDERFQTASNMKNQCLANTIMAHAMLIFLYTVVSGSNPRLHEIRRTVQSGIVLLKEAEGAIGRRQMAVTWPLSIIAGMVDPAEKEETTWVADLIERSMPWKASTGLHPNSDGFIDW